MELQCWIDWFLRVSAKIPRIFFYEIPFLFYLIVMFRPHF